MCVCVYVRARVCVRSLRAYTLLPQHYYVVIRITSFVFINVFVFLELQPSGCIFHSPVAGFSLLVFVVS